MVRLPLLEKNNTSLIIPIKTELKFDYFKYPNYFLTGKHSQTRYDTYLVGRTLRKTMKLSFSQRLGTFVMELTLNGHCDDQTTSLVFLETNIFISFLATESYMNLG